MNKNEYRIRFLEKHSNKANYNKPNEVIEKCIDLAYTDMLSGGKRVGINCKSKRIENYKKLLKKYNYSFKENLIKECCELLEKEKGKEIITNKDKNGKVCIASTFGLAQKLVNMTFKYFLVYYEYIKDAYEFDFSNCDCPLDTNILNKLNEFSDIKWSQLTEEQYKEIQETIKLKLESENKYKNEELKELKCGNLAFDFAEFFNN